MKKCYENSYAIIEHDPYFNTLKLTWYRFAKGDDFRNTMIKFYDLSQEKNVENWCFDSRKQSLVAREDQQWTVDEVMKRGYHNHSIRTAMVMPENLFMEVTVNKISQDLEKQTENPISSANDNFQQFQEMDQALKWLHSSKEQI